MSEAIIIALIGAVGVVIAAIINNIRKKSSSEKNIKIKQKANGDGNVQIGVQNNYIENDEDKIDERVEQYLDEHTISEEDIRNLFTK